MPDREIDQTYKLLNHLTQKTQQLIPLVVILGLGFFVRYAAMVGNGLWYDELQSVTHASLSIPDLLTSVRLFDPHPPLYYIQLHYWLKFGTSDIWIKSNSVLVLLLAIISLYFLADKYFNRRTAILGSLIFAIAPYAVNYGSEARNYALWMLLVIWVYEFNHRLLIDSKKAGPAFALLLTTIIFLYLHGISFIILPAIYMHALILLIQQKTSWKEIKLWGLVQGLVILAYIPWLQRAWTIGNVTPAVIPGLEDVITTLYLHLLGYCNICPSWLQTLIVLMWIVICFIILIRRPASVTVILAYTFTPILTTIIISYLIRPIWLFRGLGLIVPFVALEIAIWLDQLFEDKGRFKVLAPTIAAATLLIFCLALINQIRSLVYPWDYKQAAQFVKANANSEEVIYLPNERMFWCWNWYFLGPGQTNPIRSDYVAQTKNNITIISKPAWVKPPAQGYWQVYRDIDTPLVDSTRSTKQSWNYEGLIVEYDPAGQSGP